MIIGKREAVQRPGERAGRVSRHADMIMLVLAIRTMLPEWCAEERSCKLFAEVRRVHRKFLSRNGDYLRKRNI
jgi:hypothetical protein